MKLPAIISFDKRAPKANASVDVNNTRQYTYREFGRIIYGDRAHPTRRQIERTQ
jgi:hypothetical protein